MLLLNETQSFHINYSTHRRHFSRYSTSDRRKTKAMCLIPVSTLHGVYLLAYRTAYLGEKIHAGPALKCILNSSFRLWILHKYWEDWRGGVWEGLCPPQLGVWGLAPEKKIALKIMQLWAIFGNSFLYYSRKWGITPQSWKWGTYPSVPLLRRLWLHITWWMVHGAIWHWHYDPWLFVQCLVT